MPLPKKLRAAKQKFAKNVKKVAKEAKKAKKAGEAKVAAKVDAKFESILDDYSEMDTFVEGRLQYLVRYFKAMDKTRRDGDPKKLLALAKKLDTEQKLLLEACTKLRASHVKLERFRKTLGKEYTIGIEDF